MTNEEKAKEIASQLWSGNEMNGDVIRGIATMAAIKMAQWKEKQLIEKAISWISKNCVGYNEIVTLEGNNNVPTHIFNLELFIKDFKQAIMKE